MLVRQVVTLYSERRKVVSCGSTTTHTNQQKKLGRETTQVSVLREQPELTSESTIVILVNLENREYTAATAGFRSTHIYILSAHHSTPYLGLRCLRPGIYPVSSTTTQTTIRPPYYKISHKYHPYIRTRYNPKLSTLKSPCYNNINISKLKRLLPLYQPP